MDFNGRAGEAVGRNGRKFLDGKALSGVGIIALSHRTGHEVEKVGGETRKTG